MPIESNSKSNPLRTPWNKGRLVGEKRPRTDAPSPPVLDDLHLTALAGLLEAEEHGALTQPSTTESDSPPKIKRKN